MCTFSSCTSDHEVQLSLSFNTKGTFTFHMSPKITYEAKFITDVTFRDLLILLQPSLPVCTFVFKSNFPAVDRLESYINFKILSFSLFYKIRVSPVLFAACKIQESI